MHLRSPKWGTLLHSAAAAGHVSLLKLLVAAGAALGEEHRGKTALQVSEERGHTAATMVLRKDAQGATTLEGETVQVEKDVYVSLCRMHWEEETGRWPLA